MMKINFGIICLLAFTSPAIAQITNASHFQSILRSAQPGETITVAAGTYRLNEVYLDRRKGHGGSDRNLVTIKANGEVTLVGLSRRFIVWADYVRIEGFKFQNYRLDIFGKGNQVIDNTFRGEQAKYGAIEAGGKDLLIEGNDIEFSGGGNTRDHGIYLHKGQNVTVRNNRVVGTSGYGIHLYDEHKSSDPAIWRSHPFKMGPYLIEGNTIERSRMRSGLIVAKGRGGEFINLSDIVIRNNVFRNNKDLGVLIRNGVNVSVIDNEFFDDGLIANVPITRSGNTFNGSEPPSDPPPGGGDKDPPPPDPPPSDIIVVEDDKFRITIERKKK